MGASTVASDTRFDGRQFLIGLARGLAGALLFGLPLLMTMEMWSLGLYVDRTRLLILCILNMPLLIVLARRIGFEETASWRDAVRDAITAYGLGIVVSAVMLVALGVLDDQRTASILVAKVALQAVPASIGALLGRSQLGMRSETRDERQGEYDGETGYLHEMFMMVVGALFLSMNIAPTEEMILIAYKITPLHTLCLMLGSLITMHGFVYALHFKGSHTISEENTWWQPLLRFTIPGYVIALAVSSYTLWTFGRLDHTSVSKIVTAAIILGFPASIGAASARLIL